MNTGRITWSLNHRHMKPRESEVSALGLEVKYPDRECSLSIRLLTPVVGETPETQAALDEFRRLRDALNHILEKA